MTEFSMMPSDLPEQQTQGIAFDTTGQPEETQPGDMQQDRQIGVAAAEAPYDAKAPAQGAFASAGPQTPTDPPALEPVQKMSQMRELVMDYGASQQAAQFFKTFADGTRLRLLQALSVRELCVSDLCALLEVSQPAVSNHLRILSNLHVVKSRRSGKNIFYSLDDWHINAIIGMALEHLAMGAAQAW